MLAENTALVTTALQSMLSVTKELLDVLQAPTWDAEAVEQLTAQRTKAFAQVQQACLSGEKPTAEAKAVWEELTTLDAEVQNLAATHQRRLIDACQQLQVERESLKAYGGSPNRMGGFVDVRGA